MLTSIFVASLARNNHNDVKYFKKLLMQVSLHTFRTLLMQAYLQNTSDTSIPSYPHNISEARSLLLASWALQTKHASVSFGVRSNEIRDRALRMMFSHNGGNSVFFWHQWFINFTWIFLVLCCYKYILRNYEFITILPKPFFSLSNHKSACLQIDAKSNVNCSQAEWESTFC